MSRKILQIGFGNFGPTHLAAWRLLGLADGLFVVDPDAAGSGSASCFAFRMA
ncbi:MAG: hypothetical protein HOM07_01320 [Rhodospirillaceae bacterium]|nr:hypothetical protein [Rhodospirillaceae bacterium]